ncbi:MAG: hypothetical protein IT204_05640 [Fimbriimonadaceae bacterium]|nr:hypothetical protein [Fimbriimonadaceae bacterium]
MRLHARGWAVVGLHLGLLVACRAAPAPQAVQAAPAPRTAPAADAKVGINLSGLPDWNSERPFVDAFRTSREWISQRQGAGWGQGPKLELTPQGYPARLEAGCFAETLMLTDSAGHTPEGDYTCLYEGSGQITFNNIDRVVSNEPGRIVFHTSRGKGTVFLAIRQTDPANPVRHIKVILPGYLETWRNEPFRPEFLKMWRGVACLRFMDWMETNGSPIKSWAERPQMDDATWARHGAPLEVMLELANRLDAAPWFCLPHLADDDYVRQFAAQVKAQLKPTLKVYVEWSNETWNGMFEQSRYAGREGQARHFAQQPWEAGWKYTGYRSAQIHRIWEEVFGGATRLVRVLPTQAANAYVSERIVEFQNAWQTADALAVAPYISLNLPATGREPNAATVAGWTVEQLLDHVERVSLPECVKWMAAQQQVAAKFGLKLVAYEGGQHFVGVQGGENNDALTKLLQQANRHPRMATIYRAYFDAWERAGGDLFCYFASTSRWSKWGSWGILEQWDDNPAEAPKFGAVMDWAKRRGQTVGAP